jgi:CheY-like chemotaxis protein
MMPVMNGWDFLRACSQEARCASTPVLVVSAAHEVDELSDVVRKPFNLSDLLSAVERLVA